MSLAKNDTLELSPGCPVSYCTQTKDRKYVFTATGNKNVISLRWVKGTGGGSGQVVILRHYLPSLAMTYINAAMFMVSTSLLRLHVGALDDHDEEPVSLLALSRHGAAGLLLADGWPARH